MIFQSFGLYAGFNSKWIFICFFLYLIAFNINADPSNFGKGYKVLDVNPDASIHLEKTSKVEIILPYFPFEHFKTHIADSLFLNNSNNEALKKYKEANKYFQDTKNWEGVGYTYNMMAEIYTNRLNDFESAKHQLEKSKSFIQNTLGNDHPLISDTYLTYGSYYGWLGQPENEQESLEKSMDITSKYYGFQSIQIAETNYRIGQMHQYSRGQNELAKDHYNSALMIFEEYLPDHHPDLIKVYYALGSIYRYLEDYQRSKIHFDHAIYNYSFDSLSNIERIAKSFIAKGNVFNQINQFSYSILYYDLAIKIYEDYYGQKYRGLIEPYMGLGVGFLRIGKYDTAIQYLRKSMAIYKRHYSIENPNSYYASLHSNMGETFSKSKSKDSAHYYLFKSLNISEMYFKEDRKLISYVYYAIASMYNDFKEYDSALNYSKKALYELIPPSDNTNIKLNPEILENKNLPMLIDTYSLMATILINKFQPNSEDIELLMDALSIYRILDNLSDNIKSSGFAQESKLILSNDLHQIYGAAINCASQLYQITSDENYLNDALNFFEKNKYILLLQNLELARKSNELNIPFEYRFKEDSLKMLQAKFSQTIDNSDSQNVSFLSPGSYDIDNALRILRDEIETKFPNFYQIRFDDLSIGLSQLKEYALKNNSLLIEFYVTDSIIYAMSIGPKEVTTHKIKRDQKLNDAVNDYLYAINNIEKNEGIQEQYIEFKYSAYFIYKTLLLPFIENHKLKPDDQIIIAPDGILAQIPFEALITKIPDSEYPNYKKLDYIINSFNISYVYSFNLFLKNNDIEMEKTYNVLGFSYSGIEVSGNPEKRSAFLIELPGTNREIESIKKVVKGKNLFLMDEEATETQFKENSKHYQILHLAVHGIGDFESIINSRLVFKNQNDSLNDGNLFLYELYNIDLARSKLAILSACETGIGKEFRGEGVFSIARGFANAGCPSIIMSLWKVNDIVSSDIMAQFYKNLRKGQKINKALRTSKIAFINQTDALGAHPGNWAAFVPLGQMYSIYNKKINIMMIGIIILLITPIIIYSYYRFMKKKI
jgi:CHAT domain-containing protein